MPYKWRIASTALKHSEYHAMEIRCRDLNITRNKFTRLMVKHGCKMPREEWDKILHAHYDEKYGVDT